MDEKVIVAGHKQLENGNVFLTVKDAVAKNALFKKTCKKNGTIWLNSGVTLEQAKEKHPIGTDISQFASFGEAIPADSNGEALTNVYAVEVA